MTGLAIFCEENETASCFAFGYFPLGYADFAHKQSSKFECPVNSTGVDSEIHR